MSRIDPFCVIGKEVGQHPRTWFDDADKAVVHASNLARQNFTQYGKPTQLLVVKVVKVVEVGVPQVVVREPDEVD